MPFVRIPGLEGKVFVPETEPVSRKKHPCKDCHFCQMCTDDRCALCKVQKEAGSKKCVCGLKGEIEEKCEGVRICGDDRGKCEL